MARDEPIELLWPSVVDAVAEELPFAAAGFDAAVASLMLCSVADVPSSLAEVHRVLRPHGELRFFEHVASPHRTLHALQRAADATSSASRDESRSGRCAGHIIRRSARRLGR